MALLPFYFCSLCLMSRPRCLATTAGRAASASYTSRTSARAAAWAAVSKASGIIPGGLGCQGQLPSVALGGAGRDAVEEGSLPHQQPAAVGCRQWVSCRTGTAAFSASVPASRCHWVRRAAAQPCHNGSAGLSTPNSGFFSNSCAARPSRASASGRGLFIVPVRHRVGSGQRVPQQAQTQRGQVGHFGGGFCYHVIPVQVLCQCGHGLCLQERRK